MGKAHFCQAFQKALGSSRDSASKATRKETTHFSTVRPSTRKGSLIFSLCLCNIHIPLSQKDPWSSMGEVARHRPNQSTTAPPPPGG